MGEGINESGNIILVINILLKNLYVSLHIANMKIINVIIRIPIIDFIIAPNKPYLCITGMRGSNFSNSIS